MENPYLLPLGMLALWMCAVKSWGQGIVIAGLAPHVGSNTTFIFFTLVAMASHLWGHFRSAGER